MTRGKDGAEGIARGFVFSIDATLALFLMVVTLITATFLSAQAESSSYATLQALRSAKDVLIVMDKQGIIAEGNRTNIEFALNSTLPQGIGAHLRVETYYKDSGGFNLANISDYGDYAPTNGTTWGARHDFIGVKNGHLTNYSVARMTAWQK